MYGGGVGWVVVKGQNEELINVIVDEVGMVLVNYRVTMMDWLVWMVLGEFEK